MAALQVLSPDGNWRWVKHVDNALVRSGGYLSDLSLR